MNSPLRPSASPTCWTVCAALLACAGTGGSLYLSLGLELKACPLCLYQRAFLMAAAAVLLLGLTTELRRSAVLPLLALPALAAGLGVAGFHVLLEQSGKLECPAGVLGVGTAPQQSLALFVVTTAAVVIPSLAGAGAKRPSAAGALVLGLLLAWGAIQSAPPMPAAPTTPYVAPPDMCRPPAQVGIHDN